MKSTDSRPAGGRLSRMPLPVRLIIAGADDPWELWFTLACTGAVASFAVPSIAWWLLLPRVRRLGTAALLALPAVWILVII